VSGAVENLRNRLLARCGASEGWPDQKDLRLTKEKIYQAVSDYFQREEQKQQIAVSRKIMAGSDPSSLVSGGSKCAVLQPKVGPAIGPPAVSPAPRSPGVARRTRPRRQSPRKPGLRHKSRFEGSLDPIERCGRVFMPQNQSFRPILDPKDVVDFVIAVEHGESDPTRPPWAAAVFRRKTSGRRRLSLGPGLPRSSATGLQDGRPIQSLVESV
jgi:hypothetical protein